MKLFALTALMTMAPVCQAQDDTTVATASKPVVFVCEHGSVKSLIAASLFDRTAGKRGLPFRAIARGVNPEAHVPPAIVAAMRADGFEVENFRPQGLQPRDIAGAAEVVAIGVDLTTQADEAQAPIQSWNDVPPASVDYAAARAALQQHIDALLVELQKAGEPP
jgi:protein-tyrosine-phosphatase